MEARRLQISFPARLFAEYRPALPAVAVSAREIAGDRTARLPSGASRQMPCPSALARGSAAENDRRPSSRRSMGILPTQLACWPQSLLIKPFPRCYSRRISRPAKRYRLAHTLEVANATNGALGSTPRSCTLAAFPSHSCLAHDAILHGQVRHAIVPSARKGGSRVHLRAANGARFIVPRMGGGTRWRPSR